MSARDPFSTELRPTERQFERDGVCIAALTAQVNALTLIVSEMLALAPGTTVSKLTNIAKALDEADFRHGTEWFGNPDADLMQDDLRRWNATLSVLIPEETKEAGEGR